MSIKELPMDASRNESESHLPYNTKVRSEVERNMAIIGAIPEAVELATLPDPRRITLIHLTSPDIAQAIMEGGYQFNAMFGSADLRGTTDVLARRGHEVSERWSNETLRSLNERKLAGSHGGVSNVVVMSIPDDRPLPEGLPEPQADTSIEDDFSYRHSAAAEERDTYLDGILPVDISNGVGYVPPSMIAGVIDRERGVYIPNPSFEQDRYAGQTVSNL